MKYLSLFLLCFLLPVACSDVSRPPAPLIQINAQLPADLKDYMNQFALSQDQAAVGLTKLESLMGDWRADPQKNADPDWQRNFAASCVLLEVAATHAENLGAVPDGLDSTALACRSLAQSLRLTRSLYDLRRTSADSQDTDQIQAARYEAMSVMTAVRKHLESLNDATSSREIIKETMSKSDVRHLLSGSGKGSEDGNTGTERYMTTRGTVLVISYENGHVSRVSSDRPAASDIQIQRAIQGGVG